MNCLRDMVARFPAEAVEAQATFLFVPMVARLGADEDAACRRAAGEALTTLLKRVAGTGAGRKLLALTLVLAVQVEHLRLKARDARRNIVARLVPCHRVRQRYRKRGCHRGENGLPRTQEPMFVGRETFP